MRIKLRLPSPVAEAIADHPAAEAVAHLLERDGSTHLRLGTLPGMKMADLESLASRVADAGASISELWIARGLNDAAGEKIGGWEPVRSVERLDLGGSKLSPTFIKSVTTGPCGGSIRHVRRTGMAVADLGPLLKIPGLRSLDIAPSSKVLASAWVKRIEKSKPLAELDHLWTYGFLPSWEEALEGPLGQRLRAFGAGGAGAFSAAQAALQRADALEVLGIRDGQGPFRPASWPAPKTLRALWMQQNVLDEQAFDELEAWGVLPQLRVLTFGNIGSHGVRWLTARKDIQLSTLAITAWDLDEEDLTTLGHWVGSSGLKTLILTGPKPEHLGGFAEAADFSNLDWLEITVDRQRGDQANLAAMDERLRSNPTAASLKHRY